MATDLYVKTQEELWTALLETQREANATAKLLKKNNRVNNGNYRESDTQWKVT